MRITPKTRKILEKRAHAIQPVIQIGKNGVNPKLLKAIDQELYNHELIKLKFIGFKEVRATLSQDIETETDATIIKIIGNILILFRSHPDPDKRKIEID